MATNLVSTVFQVLTPELLTRIASALGLDRGLVERAVSAAVPGLLAALTSRAATREGAESINRAITDQHPGILTNLANIIGGTDRSALSDTGLSALTSILGGSNTSALSNAIARFSGIGDTSAKSLTGLLVPVVMGVLGEQQRSTGTSVSQILASQKDNIARALPGGFADLLRGTGMLAGLPAAASAGSRPRSYDWTPARDGPASGWLLPALVIVAIGGLLWYALQTRTPTKTVEAPVGEKTAEAPAAPPKTTAGIDTAQAFRSLTGVKVGDVDVGAQLTNAVNGLRSSVDSIKDEATAKTAVPALTDSGNEFHRVTTLISQLSPETRKSLAGAVASVRPEIDEMLNKALAIPGVGTVIQPAVDTIRSELTTLATA